MRWQCCLCKLNSGQPLCSDGGVSAGNPINVATGNKYQVEVDYQNKINPLLRVQRTYNFQSTTNHMFGANWRFEYLTKANFISPVTIPASTQSVLQVTRPNGGSSKFKRVSGDWVPVTDFHARVLGWGSEGWTVVRDSGEKEIYDKNGDLIRVTDIQGNGVNIYYHYRYSTPYPSVPRLGYLAKIVDDFGRSLTFVYNEQRRVIQVTASDGTVLKYSYTPDFNLAAITFSDGSEKKYHYNEIAYTGGTSLLRALTGITDERGFRYATWHYDAQGRVVSSEHAGGEGKTLFDYSMTGRTTVTNSLEKKTTYRFSVINGVAHVTNVEGHPAENCAAASRSYTYTPEGFISGKTDWNGGLTTYIYEAMGREVSRVERAGTANAKTTSTTWHPVYRFPLQVIEPGRVKTYTYDEVGKPLGETVTTIP